MKQPLIIAVGALIAATSFSPAAYAKHRHQAHLVAAPQPSEMNDKGEFYATPMSAGAVSLPGIGVVPGLDIAGGVVNGAAQPLLAPGAGGVVLPGLDAAGDIFTGVTQPLLPPG